MNPDRSTVVGWFSHPNISFIQIHVIIVGVIKLTSIYIVIIIIIINLPLFILFAVINIITVVFCVIFHY